MEQDQSKMLTVDEAAIELGVTDNAIYNAIRRERIATTEMYGRILIARSEIEAYKNRTKIGRPVGARNKPKDTEAQ